MQKTRQKIGDVQLIECGTQGRQRSLSVSWNCTGSWLAWASNDRMAKIWTIEGASPREVMAISGHNGHIDRVRFHPSDLNQLCTSAQDRTIRLWDLRGGTQRLFGRYDCQFGACPASVEYSSDGSKLVVAERNGFVYVYDTRKPPSSAGRGRTGMLKTFNLKPNLVDCCQLSLNGEYMIAGTTTQGEGMGALRIWRYEDETTANAAAAAVEDAMVYPGHTGAIYHFCMSPDGTRLATGGADAIVGLWDVDSMVCTHTITRRTKFLRSVSFSHDSQLVASSSEEDGIDIASSENGDWVGTLALSNRRGGGGADEICFHPKSSTLIACARGQAEFGVPNPAAVTVANFNLTHV